MRLYKLHKYKITGSFKVKEESFLDHLKNNKQIKSAIGIIKKSFR
ncbi:hypothetical protein I602_397 [Polaribacter dokdonensis DSW-5]|uniref:Uncharacterized protein n=1 Tax=Polaribacter dokdonensis DSW-5 TaxID=1300348 RepID=A0A0N0UN87_9FLAO|nr:hypothetical protein I602_397 [Polaribacter dokdonensis DSW-5]